jgi:transcriptional regulator GlxA family with amidase domain
MSIIESRFGQTTPTMQRLTEQTRSSLGAPIKVGLFVSPGFLPMDINGAHSVFGAVGAELHLLWKTTELVEGFPAWPTRPTTTFAECPQDLDVLVVGMVPPEIVGDPEVAAFFAEYGRKARYVIGTCAGSLVLGAAGLLRGVRATSNANAVEMLADYEAIPVEGGEVVIDGKFYTSGPATGSFDASLRVLAALRGEDVAKLIELIIEYDPHPPFRTGSPTLAGPQLAAMSRSFTSGLNEQYRQAGRSCFARLQAAR